MSDQKFTYKEAGVDIGEAATLVGDIGQLRARTEGKRKLHQAFGMFAASYDLSAYRQPVIVTGCDGVGTKLELLLRHDLLETAGKDLVAMNVNDILTTGGDPLLFLDYVAMDRLDRKMIGRLIAGMVDYLESCDCILAGGETAEMPGLVAKGTVELSGFCIGAAEKDDLLDPSTVEAGDVLVGFASDGFHANGWSLVRRVLAEHGGGFTEEEVRALLAPTRLYHDVVRELRGRGIRPKAMAHITGGGLPENLERVLGGKSARLEIPEWTLGAVPKVLAHCDPADCFHTFNMGIGWVAVVSPGEAGVATGAGPGGVLLGEVSPEPGPVTVSTRR